MYQIMTKYTKINQIPVEHPYLEVFFLLRNNARSKSETLSCSAVAVGKVCSLYSTA